MAAAAGLIAPVPGALLQEAIDIAMIINALRTSRCHKRYRIGEEAVGQATRGAAGIGLFMMQERASQVGGLFPIESGDAGTTVHLFLSL